MELDDAHPHGLQDGQPLKQQTEALKAAVGCLFKTREDRAHALGKVAG